MNKNKHFIDTGFKLHNVIILWLIGLIPLGFITYGLVYSLAIGWGTVLLWFLEGGFIPVLLYMWITTGRWMDWGCNMPKLLEEYGMTTHRCCHHHHYDNEADLYNQGRSHRY